MIVIPFIYFTFLTLFLINRNKGIDISAFVAIIYAFSALLSCVVDFLGLYSEYGLYEKIEISPLATFVYCFLITIIIIPFTLVKSIQLRIISTKKNRVVDYMSYILIGVFILTIIYFFSDINEVLHSNLKEIRHAIYEEDEVKHVTGFKWLYHVIINIFDQFSPIAILFFFYNVANNRKSAFFNNALFLSSLTPVIHTILIAGRTQQIYWLFTFLLVYILFRPQLNHVQRKKTMRPFAFIAVLLIIFFSAITIARFASGISEDTNDAWKSVVAYGGQTFVNFNYFFCKYNLSDMHFCRLLPLTNHFIIDHNWTLTIYRDIIFTQSGLDIGVFYSFLGDLLVDLGHFGMIIYVLLFSIVATIISKKTYNTTENLGIIILMLVLILVPLHGLFYYSYYKVTTGFYVLGSIVLYYLITYSFKVR